LKNWLLKLLSSKLINCNNSPKVKGMLNVIFKLLGYNDDEIVKIMNKEDNKKGYLGFFKK